MSKSKTPQPEAPRPWKRRISALRNLPRFFALVWKTSPGLMALDVTLRLVRSAIPVSVLYVAKLIIDEVVMLVRHHGPGDMQVLWKLVAMEFALALISDSLMRAITLIDT